MCENILHHSPYLITFIELSTILILMFTFQNHFVFLRLWSINELHVIANMWSIPQLWYFKNGMDCVMAWTNNMLFLYVGRPSPAPGPSHSHMDQKIQENFKFLKNGQFWTLFSISDWLCYHDYLSKKFCVTCLPNAHCIPTQSYLQSVLWYPVYKKYLSTFQNSKIAVD